MRKPRASGILLHSGLMAAVAGEQKRGEANEARRCDQTLMKSEMMQNVSTTPLRIGAWRVDPATGQLSRDGETARLEVRTMRLLLYLAERAGDVVSIEELLTNVWAGVIVTPDSVYQAVTALRRVLGDDSKQPTYIATIPRRGYRMVASVAPWVEPEKATAPRRHRSRFTPALLWSAGTMMFIALVVAFLFRDRATSTDGRPTTSAARQSQTSVAVLPFLDLTEGMQQEEFADGMTEELIGMISKIPGVRVPAPTSSFYYKGKQVPIGEIAKALNVAYVLDGSVRKSGARLRVAARLIRADNAFVVWSESYDRPFDDLLMVQDDIAGEVTKALRASIEAYP
jgi:transcriptional activator of cad operon